MNDPLSTKTIRSNSNMDFDPVITALLVLGLVLAIAALGKDGSTAPSGPVPKALASINPNTAPWWELMVLPEIGETTARRIVEYREAEPRRDTVFHNPTDLDPVPGIGPMTIQRIAPYLRFHDR